MTVVAFDRSFLLKLGRRSGVVVEFVRRNTAFSLKKIEVINFPPSKRKMETRISVRDNIYYVMEIEVSDLVL